MQKKLLHSPDRTSRVVNRFADRRQAGQVLASRLLEYAGRTDVVVLGLPRGGIPVAYEVAVALGAPLSVLVVRPLCISQDESLAIGVIASGGLCLIDRGRVISLGISESQVAAIIEREAVEVARRDRAYRGNQRFPDIPNRVVIVVDDGSSAGSMMPAAIMALRRRNPARIIAAAPVTAAEACTRLRRIADECVCAFSAGRAGRPGMWYEDFQETPDRDVTALLEHAASRHPEPAAV